MQESATSFFVANDETPNDSSLDAEEDDAVIVESAAEEGDAVSDQGAADDDVDLSGDEEVSLDPLVEVNESQVTSMIVAGNWIR